ncbi:MAG: chemotaxis protein CheW [Candidatus Bathyarchaeota archaeon]|nr:chemotaxis protein CheW [Candidatus Bathyarchaeum sp.]
MTQIDDQQIVKFTIGEVNYGVPVEQVREVRDMQAVTPVPGAPTYVEGVTNLRGQIITVMDLRKRLNIEERKGSGAKIIVIEMGKAAVGVVVDTVTEVSTIAEADIERDIRVTNRLEKYVEGVGKQAEKLIVVLNLAKIISDIKEDLPEHEKAATKIPVTVEQVPIA